MVATAVVAQDRITVRLSEGAGIRQREGYVLRARATIVARALAA